MSFSSFQIDNPCYLMLFKINWIQWKWWKITQRIKALNRALPASEKYSVYLKGLAGCLWAWLAGPRLGWLSLRDGWLGLRPGWLGSRPGWMAQRGEDKRMYGQMFGRKISPYYRTIVPYWGRYEDKCTWARSQGRKVNLIYILLYWNQSLFRIVLCV